MIGADDNGQQPNVAIAGGWLRCGPSLHHDSQGDQSK